MNQKYSFLATKATLRSDNLLSTRLSNIRKFTKGIGVLAGLPPFENQTFRVLVLQIGFYKALRVVQVCLSEGKTSTRLLQSFLDLE